MELLPRLKINIYFNQYIAGYKILEVWEGIANYSKILILFLFGQKDKNFHRKFFMKGHK